MSTDALTACRIKCDGRHSPMHLTRWVSCPDRARYPSKRVNKTVVEVRCAAEELGWSFSSQSNRRDHCPACTEVIRQRIEQKRKGVAESLDMSHVDSEKLEAMYTLLAEALEIEHFLVKDMFEASEYSRTHMTLYLRYGEGLTYKETGARLPNKSTNELGLSYTTANNLEFRAFLLLTRAIHGHGGVEHVRDSYEAAREAIGRAKKLQRLRGTGDQR